jgi:hypothetical protein
MVMKHDVHLNVYSSIFGNFEGAAKLVNFCEDHMIEETQLKCQVLLVQMEEIKKYTDCSLNQLQNISQTLKMQPVLPHLNIKFLNPFFNKDILDEQFGKPELR